MLFLELQTVVNLKTQQLTQTLACLTGTLCQYKLGFAVKKNILYLQGQCSDKTACNRFLWLAQLDIEMNQLRLCSENSFNNFRKSPVKLTTPVSSLEVNSIRWGMWEDVHILSGLGLNSYWTKTLSAAALIKAGQCRWNIDREDDQMQMWWFVLCKQEILPRPQWQWTHAVII